MKISARTLLTAVGCAAILLVAGCQSVSTTNPSGKPEVTATKLQPMTLDLKAGQVLQFAFIRAKEGAAAKAVRTRYFETAIPHAESLGDEFLGNLKVNETMIGENEPRAIALYAFPDEAAWKTFQASPEWDEYQTMRRAGWDELHIFSSILSEDKRITFDPQKDYTFAAAWTKPDTMPSYKRYLDGIEADFDEIGARYVAQLGNVSLQSQTDNAADPSQITIVEWSKGPNLRELQRTQAYKDSASHFQAAINRFDLYWITKPK